MKSEYRVGELAKFFGVSSDTLRLYDKLGILSPKKNKSNNYRTYTREDFICLDYVIRLRKMQFSLEDIRVLVNETTPNRAEAMMANQNRLLDEKINELENLKIMVHDYKKSFGNVIQHLGSISIQESPVIIYKELGDSMLNIMADFSALTPNHVPHFTFVCPKEKFLADAFVTDITESSKRANLFHHAVTLLDDEDFAEKEELAKKGFIVLPHRKCVYSIGKNYTNLNYDAFIKVRQYILDHHLEIVGDVLFRAISIRNNMEKSVDYYEFWAPIQ